MKAKVETLLGIIGGSLGVLASVIILSVALISIWPGGGSMIYGSPVIIGDAGTSLIMIVWGMLSLVVGLVGIAGGIIAKTDMSKGGKLMLVSGIIGFFLYFSIWWIIPGVLLISGGIMAMRSSE
ncbi:hypothetical protein [Methanococcoides seepicolus]|uniref:DUF4064 domain-containing protein n=1 Tax=Methanococcoides seepicolus TaxID=2828780 RepID=A0A9E4ZDW7_9EURY|nr:hypothetical protein [Methanococcoides seepicolus]MCM1985981.1 DUF4064 domain-containing protein [Methanococcoides seepicolus]